MNKVETFYIFAEDTRMKYPILLNTIVGTSIEAKEEVCNMLRTIYDSVVLYILTNLPPAYYECVDYPFIYTYVDNSGEIYEN